MHVDVNDILKQGEGAQAEYSVDGETPELDGVTLTSPITGTVRIMGTKDGILAAGQLSVDVELECDRCLRAFSHPITFPVQAEFEDEPDEYQFPIDRYGKIDLTEPIRQEVEVHLPLQRLCQEDCAGIELKQKKDN